MGDAERWVSDALANKKRIMGFGHRIYRAEDPRSRLLKGVAKELGAPNIEVAEELEQVALDRAAGALARPRPRDERRVLLGDRARRRRDPAAARTGDVRLLARGRLVGAHPRAEADRAPVPALGPLRRARSPLAPAGLTLAEAAAAADALAGKGGAERELAELRAPSGPTSSRRPRGTPTTGSARSRTGRSASSASARSSSSCAAGSRTRARPAAARRSSRSSCSRAGIPRPVNDVRPLLHTLANADDNEAVRRLALVCLRNGSPQRDTIVLLEHLAEDDDEARELRATAKRVAQELRKRSRRASGSRPAAAGRGLTAARGADCACGARHSSMLFCRPLWIIR